MNDLDFDNVPPLTREQAAVVSLYTGFLVGDLSDMHQLAERLMGYPIWVHQFPQLKLLLHEASRPLFVALSGPEKPL